MVRTTSKTMVLWLLLLLPAMAHNAGGTWRSSSGSVVKVDPYFNIGIFRQDGSVGAGRGWWARNAVGLRFHYQLRGIHERATATFEGPDRLSVRHQSRTVVWRRISQRATIEGMEVEEGWFTPQRPVANPDS